MNINMVPLICINVLLALMIGTVLLSKKKKQRNEHEQYFKWNRNRKHFFFLRYFFFIGVLEFYTDEMLLSSIYVYQSLYLMQWIFFLLFFSLSPDAQGQIFVFFQWPWLLQSCRRLSHSSFDIRNLGSIDINNLKT
jgi:hypothetical protein